MPKTLDDLKVNIEREIRNIKQDVLKILIHLLVVEFKNLDFNLKSRFLNFRKRLNLIIEAKGGHIEQK